MVTNDELLSVPSPEDDVSEIARRVIESIRRDYEAQLLELASSLDYSSNLDKSIIPVLAGCHESSNFFLILGCEMDSKDQKDIYEYFIRMQKVGENLRPSQKIHIMAISSQIGMDYRMRYLSESG